MKIRPLSCAIPHPLFRPSLKAKKHFPTYFSPNPRVISPLPQVPLPCPFNPSDCFLHPTEKDSHTQPTTSPAQASAHYQKQAVALSLGFMGHRTFLLA